MQGGARERGDYSIETEYKERRRRKKKTFNQSAHTGPARQGSEIGRIRLAHDNTTPSPTKSVPGARQRYAFGTHSPVEEDVEEEIEV